MHNDRMTLITVEFGDDLVYEDIYRHLRIIFYFSFFDCYIFSGSAILHVYVLLISQLVRTSVGDFVIIVIQ